MSRVANISIDGGIDVPELVSQLLWLTENAITIPPWLSALSSESDPQDSVLGRQYAVDTEEFRAFRKLLCAKWDESYTARCAVPRDLDGLMHLFDYLYDKIGKVAPWNRPWRAQ